MDKRSLFFFLALTISFLGINYFFDLRREESLQETRQKEKARKIEIQKSLKREIANKTATAEELPLVKLYVDKEEKQIFCYAISADDSLITISKTADLPKELFANNKRYSLAYRPLNVNEPAVYEAKKGNTLTIGDLPYFGRFELQLVSFPSSEEKSPEITLAIYDNGFLSLPQRKLAKIMEELGEHPPFRQPETSLALMKIEGRYLPLAIYKKDSEGLLFLEQITGLKKEIFKLAGAPQSDEKNERRYTLENEYMQITFSDVGAAITEINLPFKKEEGKNKSVVKEIEFDREILKNREYDAYFPLSNYLSPSENPQGPYKENGRGSLGGYYPLLRRELIRADRRKTIAIPPEFYAFNIISQYPEMAELHYDVQYFDREKIVFEARQRSRKITKTYSLSPEKAPYCFDLQIDIEGDSSGLWLNSGVIEAEWISNSQVPSLKYHMTRKGKPETIEIDLPKEPTLNSAVNLDWISVSNGFFGIVVDPLSEMQTGYRAAKISGASVPSRLLLLREINDKFTDQNLYGYQVQLPLELKGKSAHFRVFAGPLATAVLKTVDNIYSNSETGYETDYISTQSSHGILSFISTPFSKFLFALMNLFHYFTGSWAFSIILLTIALRIMLYPLNAWSTKSMLKMQQISPKVQKIQEKYKKEPQKAQLEIMNLYRENGVNPVSGCFPILIQMPFLIGMFNLLKSAFELRGASFIPGWIDNLSAPDVLFSWTTPLFFIGNQLHLLPILLGAVMYFQQKITSSLPKDTSKLTDQQKQQKTMGSVMTIVFSVMFYHVPSGLNLYWLSSMLLGILQQWWTHKKLKPLPEPANKLPKKPG